MGINRSSLSIAIWILFTLLIVGCGSSGEDYVFTSTGTNGPAASASVRLESVLAQTAVPSQVDSIRASGFNEEQNLRFGPVTKSKASAIQWDEVSVDVTDFVLEYLSQGQVVGIAQVNVTLVAGQVYLIENPTILGISATLESVTLNPTNLSLASGTSASNGHHPQPTPA